MSIIGTRPPLISETNLYELHHRARLAIKPGITGMWQVSGRSDITDFEEVVRLDKEYITNWNIGLAKNEIHTATVLIKDKFYHTECQRHIVQQATFFQHTQGAMFRVCQLYFSTQTAMTAHIALTPLKSAAVRHGINAIVADIYNVAAAYDNSLADTQKILLRQSR